MGVMPKEKLQSNPDGPVLSVGWSNDVGNVQIGIERPSSVLSGADRTELYTDVLSREDINWAIRTLRKARDKGLGRDE